MADYNYQGEITKEQFLKTITAFKSDIDQSLFVDMFYALDTSLNGLISQDQFNQFICAYGASNSKEVLVYQKKALNRFGAMLKRKNISVSEFISRMKDPILVYDFSNSLHDIGLTNNEIMIILKYFDASRKGKIRHEVYLKMMQNFKCRDQKQLQNINYEKSLKQFCVHLRELKINPITLYEQADIDKNEEITPYQLQQSFKKILPGQTTFQIKKWIKLINLNNDNEITKEQFTSSIRCFYSLQQLNKFSIQYQKDHPNVNKGKKNIKEEQIPVEKIMMELSEKIQDSGMSKKEVFDFIDFNKNGTINKEEMIDGLKGLGMHVGFIGRVMSVFDRDCSGQIDVDEWLHLLGEDVQMSEVGLPEDLEEEVGGERSKPVKKNEKKQKQNREKNDIAQTNQNKSKQSTIKQNRNKKQSVQKKKLNKTKQQELNKNSNNKNRNIISLKQQQQYNIKIKNKKQQQKKNNQKMKNINKKQEKYPKKIQKIQKPIKQKQKQKIQFLQDEMNQNNNNNNNNYNNNNNNNDYNNNQNQIDVQHIQIEIGIKFKKNKINIISYFKQIDKKNLKYLSQKDFYYCIDELKIQSTVEQKKQLFIRHCVDGGIIRYEDFLIYLADMYAGDVEEEQQQQKSNGGRNNYKYQQEQQQYLDARQFKKQQQKQNQQQQQSLRRSINNNPITNILQDNNNNNNKNIKQNIKQIKKRTNPIKKDLNNLLIINEVLNEVLKRGKNLNSFKQLLKLSIKNGQHNKQGYKLSQYINSQKELKKLNQIYLPKANNLKKKNNKFIDKQFPAQIISLNKNYQNNNNNNISQIHLLKWKHYSQLYQNAKLFSGGIEPNDIKQGSLGDCYLLCSLSCLAQYTNLIQRLFQYFDIINGYFLIWLCIDGEWKLVQVDGYIPTDPTGKSPAFSHTESEQLWVILLQKAYAKVYGDYNKISGGQPYQAIKDLSGGPGRSFSHQSINKQEIWQKLYQANKQQFLMTCGTQMKSDKVRKIDGHSENITTQGVVLGHAYSILDIRQIGKNHERIIQLRNPWGKIQWNGDWSDKSQKWTQQLKEQLNYQLSQIDGIFWMPFNIFYQQYNTTSINYIRPNYYYDNIKQTNIKTIIVKTQTNTFKNGYFMVSQLDHRHLGLPINTPYQLCHIIGLLYNQNAKKVIKKVGDNKYLYQRQASIQFKNLKEEQQAIVIVCLEHSTSINVGYYGDGKTQFSIDNNCLPYMEGLAELSQNCQGMSQQAGFMRSWMIGIGDIVFLCFKNISQKFYILDIETKQPDNIKIIPPQSIKNRLKIQKGQMKTIKGKIIDAKKGYSFGAMSISKVQL